MMRVRFPPGTSISLVPSNGSYAGISSTSKCQRVQDHSLCRGARLGLCISPGASSRASASRVALTDLSWSFRD